MALIKCTDCSKEISSEAEACPNCGKPLKIKKQNVNEKELSNTKKTYKETVIIGENFKKEKQDDQLSFNHILIIGAFLLLIILGISSCFGSDSPDPSIEDYFRMWEWQENQ